MALCTKWFVLCSVYYIQIYRLHFLLFTVQQKGKSKRLLKCTKTKKTDENKRYERSNWQFSGRRREKEVSRVRLPGKARRRVRRSWLVERGAAWRSSAREETHRPPNTKHHAHTYHTCYLKLHAIYCTAYVFTARKSCQYDNKLSWTKTESSHECKLYKCGFLLYLGQASSVEFECVRSADWVGVRAVFFLHDSCDILHASDDGVEWRNVRTRLTGLMKQQGSKHAWIRLANVAIGAG